LQVFNIIAQKARDDSKELLNASKELMRLSELDSSTLTKLAKASKKDTFALTKLAKASNRDSSALKIIAIMTTLFLPGTFVSVRTVTIAIGNLNELSMSADIVYDASLGLARGICNPRSKPALLDILGHHWTFHFGCCSYHLLVSEFSSHVKTLLFLPELQNPKAVLEGACA
jgi:hypothetical protein